MLMTTMAIGSNGCRVSPPPSSFVSNAEAGSSFRSPYLHRGFPPFFSDDLLGCMLTFLKPRLCRARAQLPVGGSARESHRRYSG